MKYSKEEVIQYVREEDVKFIRLAFCDVFGKQKNISIMPQELSRAFEYGIAIDASAIAGFGDENHSDLFLHPEADTLTLLPCRPEHGRVVRLFCNITYPNEKYSNVIRVPFKKTRFRQRKFPDINFSVAQNKSFIYSNWMTTEIQPKNLMITLLIWISPRKTKVKISAAKYA